MTPKNIDDELEDDLPDDTDVTAPALPKKAKKVKASTKGKAKSKTPAKAKKVKASSQNKTRERRLFKHTAPKVGTTFIKTHKGKTHTMRVVAGENGAVEYAVGSKRYKTPSAAVFSVVDTPHSPNGWTWWGIEVADSVNGAKPAAKKAKAKA